MLNGGMSNADKPNAEMKHEQQLDS